MKKIGKTICVALAGTMLAASAVTFASCKPEEEGPPVDEYESLSSADLPETTSVLSLDTYRDKTKGALVGSMAGVAYGYPVEFWYKTWIPDSSLPKWYDDIIQNAYTQDDIYLSVTAIEALSELGLDVTSRELGIYMYNKDFEFWNGSNNDVLARGYAPPFSGYPKYSTSHLTGAYPDGNSYQCGASFGGLLGLNMTGFLNETCQKFAEICCYGDGIYSMQFIAAMYGAAFFTDDIDEIIQAGLASIPEESWSALVVRNVLENYDAGMTAQENFNDVYATYVLSDEYNWIGWPYDGILLDAKMCSAFTLIGLLYGEEDMDKTMRLTISCANDSDSTAAAAGGILATIKGYSALDDRYKNGLIEDQKFKYSSSTLDETVELCVELLKEIVVREGGKVAYVDGVLSYVIPQEAKTAQIEEYKNSKYPEPMELMTYTEEEMDRMRSMSDPGFERSTNQLANGWSSDSKANTSIEWMEQTAYTGLSNAKITAKQGAEVNLYNSVSVEKNTNYKLTCMVQASDGFASEVSLAVWNSSGDLLRSKVCETGDGWIKITMTVNSGNNDTLRIGAIVKGANTTDYLRLDDFTFQKTV